MIVSFLRPLIDSQSQTSRHAPVFIFHFLPVLFNFLGLFAVDLRQLSLRLAMSPQQFIELGLNCLCVPMLCPLDEKGHSQGGAGGHGMPVERGPIKISHRQKYAKSTPKAAGVAVSSPRRVRKLRMASIIGISSTPFRSTHHATVGAIL